MKYWLSAFLLLASTPALACSPAFRTFEQQIEGAAVIFAGKLVEVQGQDTLVFDVHRYWKGRPSKQMAIKTVANTCGMAGLQPGSEVMVFATGDPLATTASDGTFVIRFPDGRDANNTSSVEEKLGAGKVPE